MKLGLCKTGNGASKRFLPFHWPFITELPDLDLLFYSRRMISADQIKANGGKTFRLLRDKD